MPTVKTYLKIYSLSLGFLVTCASFFWIGLLLYVVSRTDPTATDLLTARYLDISFGVLAFSSALTLMYGAFVESKTWLSVWTFGSATVLVGSWSWFFYRKYYIQTPESLAQDQSFMLGLTIGYMSTEVPVMAYYKYLESPDNFLRPVCCAVLPATNIHVVTTRSRRRRRRGEKYGYDDDEEEEAQAEVVIGAFEAKKSKEGSGYRVTIPVEEDLFNPV